MDRVGETESELMDPNDTPTVESLLKSVRSTLSRPFFSPASRRVAELEAENAALREECELLRKQSGGCMAGFVLLLLLLSSLLLCWRVMCRY